MNITTSNAPQRRTKNDIYKILASNKSDIIFSAGTAHDKWDNKSLFQKDVVMEYGEFAGTSGTNMIFPRDSFIISESDRHMQGKRVMTVGEILEFCRSEIDEICRFAKNALAEGMPVVYKTKGHSGSGILCLSPNQTFGSNELERSMASFLRNKIVIAQDSSVLAPAWIRAEYFHRYYNSLGCSFFIEPDGAIIPLMICEQNLSSSGEFLGARSLLSISEEDCLSIMDLCIPLVEKMRGDGICGFVGVDLILVEHKKKSAILLPDSPNAVIFVEANPFLNQHDEQQAQILRIAESIGCGMNEIAHSRIGHWPIYSDRGMAFRWWLRGVVKPFAGILDEESLYFLIDENEDSTRNEILFLGLRSRKTEIAVGAAESILRRRGVSRC